MPAHQDLARMGALACFLAACGSSAPSATGNDGGLDATSIDGGGAEAGAMDGTTETGGNADATADSPAEAAERDTGLDAGDGGTGCDGILQDAGFSSLAELPIASLCAGSYNGNSVLEGPYPCQGSILVEQWSIVDCFWFWLFDAKTGALQATGGGCNSNYTCGAAIPGFQYPVQCFNNWGWIHEENLCADGGTDAGAIADASVDRAD